MSAPITESNAAGKMCYIRLHGTSSRGERAKCVDYNDTVRIGVFVLRSGECIIKPIEDIISIATDQSPFSQPEPLPPVTAKSLLSRIKSFFTT